MEWTAEPDLAELQKAYAILRVNPRDGLERLEKLAGAGSTASMLYLGDAYYHGMGVKKDIKLATHWYEMADQRNSREAAYILGRIYTDSNDIDAAFSAYSRGVARESPPAMYRLAYMHRMGLGTERSETIYRSLVERAAARGHVLARRDFACLLMHENLGIKSKINGFCIYISNIIFVLYLAVRAMRHGTYFDERLM